MTPTPTPPTEKCCEKCVEKGDFRGEIYHIDPDCPCHTTDTGWIPKKQH